MHSLDQQVIACALKWHQQGAEVWLCTVLRSWGSAPRAPGAMLAANQQGEFCGSLSGGCIEDDFLARVQQGEFMCDSQLVRYGEGGLAPQIRLPCGGVLEVLVERLPADAASLAHLSRLQQTLTGDERVVKQVTIGERAQLEAVDAAAPRTLHYDSVRVILPIGSVLTLLLAGYSTVAHECLRIAQMLKMQVIVCEHRETFWRQLCEQQSGQAGLRCINQHPARYLECYGATRHTAIVCTTHDARVDDLTLLEAVNTPAFYLGAMGSSSSSRQRIARLRSIGELDEAKLQRIHAPVGLPIGSKTPTEIALAIMADIVRVKNGR
ncbi:XdhC family protein [Mixta tenebrionis]|uniref:XdhC family protein n=1 Tax=Mixta tenebrionis TaxID=2562439 RepID=A0A506VDY9_9GAMM|nr:MULTISPECIES: XdhC family protein [Mixta]QHM75719.1 putative xanthine dehydrogenase subunit A [Mixta theicola]TPW44324.1 XdhC family protein [Mixta tenebrionis]